jgi:hypothetical protein
MFQKNLKILKRVEEPNVWKKPQKWRMDIPRPKEKWSGEEQEEDNWYSRAPGKNRKKPKKNHSRLL